MTTVRFYADVPKYKTEGIPLWATTNPIGLSTELYTRVAFDVELPPNLWIDADQQAPMTVARVVSTQNKTETVPINLAQNE